MNGMTVVLGWDALDHELVGEYHLEDSFGPAHTDLETFNNPYLGEPHTDEVWPSTTLVPCRDTLRVAVLWRIHNSIRLPVSADS